MGRIRSFKAGARRSVVASLVVVCALSFAAVPASAKPGGGKGGAKSVSTSANTSASVTFTESTWFPGAYCTFDVSYAWKGFSGQSLSASVRIVDDSGATVATGPMFINAAGDGRAEFIINFNGSVGTSRNLYARAALADGGVEISSSVATSPAFPTTCGGSYGLRTFTIIDLT